MGCWSQLNNDLLCSIAEEKMSLEDYIRCQAVCKNWRLALKEISSLRRPQLPWLILPYCHHDDKSSSDRCRGFFCISEMKVHHLEFPEGYDDKICVGSSHGWLVMVENTSPAIFLLNPLTKCRIELPPVTTFPDVLDFRSNKTGEEYVVVCQSQVYKGEEDTLSLEEMSNFYMHKVILSCDPTMNDCIVVAICGEMDRLAFCRVGGDTWTVLDNEINTQLDVVYWRDEFYAIKHSGSLVVYDLKSSPPNVVKVITEPNPPVSPFGNKYLAVDSVRGELLLILRHLKDDDDDIYRTSNIEIYRLDEEKKVWKKGKDLGDNILFLGVNCSMCFSAIDFPECKSNSIYFTDDYRDGYVKGKIGGHDTGIFDMDDDNFKTFSYCLPHSFLIWPPPVWVTPCLASALNCL